MKNLFWTLFALAFIISLVSCNNTDKIGEENIEIYRHLLAELDKGNAAIADEIISPECIWHMPGGAEVIGARALKESDAQTRVGFPDIHHNIEVFIAEGDMLAVRLINTATHNGVFSGIKPTGEKVIFTANNIFRFREGKIVEGWIEYNALGLMLKIGAVQFTDQANFETKEEEIK